MTSKGPFLRRLLEGMLQDEGANQGDRALRRQSQSRRAGDRSPGAAGSATTDSSSRTRPGPGRGREADTSFSGETTGAFLGNSARGHGATVKSRGKSKTEYSHGTLCGSSENNTYTVK